MTIQMLKEILERRGVGYEEILLHDGRISLFIEGCTRTGKRVSISWIFDEGRYVETFSYIYPGVLINNEAEEYHLPWFLGDWHDIDLGPLHGWWKVDRHKIYLPTAVIGKFIELDEPGDRRLHFALFWNQQLLVERQPGLAMLHTGSELINRIIWKLCGYD